MLKGFREAIRYGRVRHRLNARLRQAGLHINLYYLVREGRNTDALEVPEPPAGFRSELLDPVDIPAIAECSTWASLENIQGRVDKGHLCVVIKRDHEIAGYTWADLDEVNDAACNYELQPGEAYLYDAYVSPEFRGHGLAPYLRLECYKHLHAAGTHTFFSVSDYFGAPAIRFKKKLNAEFISLHLQIKVGGRELLHWRIKGSSESN